MTTFLAVWGAVLSTLLAALKVVESLVDRPRLKVRSLPTIGVHPASETVLRIAVLNRGRRPTTVTEAGYIVQGLMLMGEPGQQQRGERKITLDGPPTVLAGGEMAEYVSAPLQTGGFPPFVFLDSPLRAYVKDLNGDRVYGPAAPLLRQAFDSWQGEWSHPPEPN